MRNRAEPALSLAPADPLRVARLGEMVSRSSHMAELFGLVEPLAAAGAPVLIEGERGTGKRTLAQEIHRRRTGGEAPFLHVRCGGDERDCRARLRDSLATAAPRGTVFLEEVTELSAALQAELFAAVGAGADEPSASAPPIHIIAATRVDIQALVRARRFSEALYHELAWLPVRIPPLRARREDIELLARHFLARIAWRERREVPALPKDALDALRARAWPGNVRELEALMEQLAAAPSGAVRAAELPADRGRPTSLLRAARRADEEKLEHIESVLRAAGNDYPLAARALGVHPSTLYRWRRSLSASLG